MKPGASLMGWEHGVGTAEGTQEVNAMGKASLEEKWLERVRRHRSIWIGPHAARGGRQKMRIVEAISIGKESVVVVVAAVARVVEETR